MLKFLIKHILCVCCVYVIVACLFPYSLLGMWETHMLRKQRLLFSCWYVRHMQKEWRYVFSIARALWEITLVEKRRTEKQKLMTLSPSRLTSPSSAFPLPQRGTFGMTKAECPASLLRVSQPFNLHLPLPSVSGTLHDHFWLFLLLAHSA